MGFVLITCTTLVCVVHFLILHRGLSGTGVHFYIQHFILTSTRMYRLGSREAEGYRRALLQQEDRELTEMKVATEWRRYDQIRKRIGHFLHDVDNPARRASLPILPDSAVQEVELQDS